MANWFVKASGLANENIMAMLSADGQVGGTAHSGLLDKEGQPHDLILIPPRYFQPIMKARREQPTIYDQVRFFVQHQPGGTVQSAAWLGKSRPAAVVTKAIADHKQRQERKSKTPKVG